MKPSEVRNSMKDEADVAFPTHLWSFGKYIDPVGQTATLAIFYPIKGKKAEKPLMMPLSGAQNAKKIHTQLIDSGADIGDRETPDALAFRLREGTLTEGVFAHKMGVVEHYFVLPGKVYGGRDDEIVVEPTIVETAKLLLGVSKGLEAWQKGVARRARRSTLCMFAIMQALSAVIQARVLRAADEGFLINLAGPSSVGKTAVLMCAKSVSGPGGKLLSWDKTDRSLFEGVAALSDTFVPIDDLDKVSNERGFARRFTGIIHALTSGASRTYSAVVRPNLPNLNWSFSGMTGARTTVEELSREQGHPREAHERVRCLDVKVPSAAAGGIWDRRKPNDPTPRKLTDELKSATTTVYGSPLRAWLARLTAHPELYQQARELIDHYVDNANVADADAIGHRVAKKFGLVYAAGILAQEAGILPWGRDDILAVVQAVHANALETLYAAQREVELGLQSLRRDVNLPTTPRFASGERPQFATADEAELYIVASGSGGWVRVQLPRFARHFVSTTAAELARESLEREGALSRAKDGKVTRQFRVRVGRADDERKVRSMSIKLSALT